MSPYGTLALSFEGGKWSFCIPGHSVNNARTLPTIKMVRQMLAMVGRFDRFLVDNEPAIIFIQYDDFAHNDMRSVAYGTKKGQSNLVALIPDTYFFENEGYRLTRELVEARKFPEWRNRVPKVFWRGSPTCKWRREDGAEITEVKDIMRVRLCESLRFDARSDVGLIGTWGSRIAHDKMLEYFQQLNIIRNRVSMEEHGQYRYQIDIDGVANAWSFFDKLLMGSCILKVESQYQQWFYGDIRPWEHYVPVSSDLSDLAERIDWCFEKESLALDIALAGQAYALSHTFEAAIERAVSALYASMILL